MAHKLPFEKKARAAELCGMGLTQAEAAGATGMAQVTVEKLLAQPEFKAIREKARQKFTSMGDLKAAINDLVTATDDDGEPLHGVNAKGVELMLKYADKLEDAEPAEMDDITLPGVMLICPEHAD